VQSENHVFQKRVNLFDGISIVAGAMIGSCKTVQNFFSSTKVIALFGFIAIGFLATKSINSPDLNKTSS
jgi:uncharacterized membrane protein